MDRLLEFLGPAVQFVYTCWDRIALNGYIERLQRPETLIHLPRGRWRRLHRALGPGAADQGLQGLGTPDHR